MAIDLTLLKWKWESKIWTLNRIVICNVVGHHWKRVELFPAACTRCRVLLEYHEVIVAETPSTWPKRKAA